MNLAVHTMSVTVLQACMPVYSIVHAPCRSRYRVVSCQSPLLNIRKRDPYYAHIGRGS